MRYSNSIFLPHSNQQVFDLVANIESYPEFLPGWKYARVLDRQKNQIYAEQHLHTGPVEFRFHTTAVLEPCSEIQISSSSGPFRELNIDWRFTSVSDGECRATIDIKSIMQPGLKNAVLFLLLEAGSSKLLPLFEQRARVLYGYI